MTPQQMVAQFHRHFGLPVRRTPVIPGDDEKKLRRKLLSEEWLEVDEAIYLDSLPMVAQELADLVYVAYGAALTYGIDLDAALVEVHRANMSKLGPDGAPLLREDGKVLKGPNYKKPDMNFVLESQRRGAHTDPPIPPPIDEVHQRAFR